MFMIATPRSLEGMNVGLSGAIPDPKDLEQNDSSEFDIRSAVGYVVESVLRRGGRVVHGNHPSYRDVVERAVANVPQSSLAPGLNPVKMYVVAPFVTAADADDLRDKHGYYADIEFVGPIAEPDWSQQTLAAQRISWLQVMREKLAAEVDALVCIGGRGVRPDVPRPGIQAEASLAVLAGKPFYLAAALGGFAEHLERENLLPASEKRRNGLLPGDNRALSTEADPSKVTELILKGLDGVWRSRGTAAHTSGAGEVVRPDSQSAELAAPAKPAKDPSNEGKGVMTNDYIQHLRMIQRVIDRLANNSFMYKGWSVVLVSALLTLTARDLRPGYALVALLPTVCFWWLDAYYLRQERLFRRLFEQVRAKGLAMDPPTTDFSMRTSAPKPSEPDARNFTLYSVAFSGTEAWPYVPLLLTLGAVAICGWLVGSRP
jgi:SLOG cluster2